MTDANIMALLMVMFAVHCTHDYAKLKLMITGKPLWGSRVEPVVDQDKLDDKLAAMAKEALTDGR